MEVRLLCALPGCSFQLLAHFHPIIHSVFMGERSLLQNFINLSNRGNMKREEGIFKQGV